MHDRLGESTDQKGADALALFGATGDLTRKKVLPALYHLTATGRLAVPVVGVARSGWDDTVRYLAIPPAVSGRTVETRGAHIHAHIQQKLDARIRAELVKRARAAHLLDETELDR